MSTSLAEAPPVSAQTLEHVLGTGDLSKLTTQQRVEYYARTCQSLGLNPLTRPFRFLAFNGQIQLYATKDCGDQLRTIRSISLNIVDKQIDGELFIVTARARTKDGREDEDLGAVALAQLKGDSRANAIMRAMTKAKRRVTLSICGLGGMPDESELDTMPGAVTFDAEDEMPVAPIRAAAAATQRAPRIAERAPAYEAPQAPVQRVTLRQWLDEFEARCAAAQTQDEGERILREEAVLRLDDPALQINENVRSRALAVRKAMVKRLWPDEPPEDEAEPEPLEIIGQDKVAAG